MVRTARTPGPRCSTPAETARAALLKYDRRMPYGNNLSLKYADTTETSLLPVTGQAIHSGVAPHVTSQNLAAFVSSGPSPTLTNTFRASFSRTRMTFDPPDDSNFLLRAPLQLNATRIQDAAQGFTLIDANSADGRRLLQHGPCNQGASCNPDLVDTQTFTGPIGQVRWGASVRSE